MTLTSTELIETVKMARDMEQMRNELTALWEMAHTADQNGKKLDPHNFKTKLMRMACMAGRNAGTARRLAEGDTTAPLLKTRHIPVMGVVK